MNSELLEAKLQELHRNPSYHGQIVRVIWDLERYENPKIKIINEALKRSDEEERLSLTKELLDFYQSSQEDMERIFGPLPQKTYRIMGTIASQGKQFRIWNGLFTHIHVDHADSCGRNLVLGVYGSAKQIEKYVEKLLPSDEYVNFYGRWDNTIIRVKGW